MKKSGLILHLVTGQKASMGGGASFKGCSSGRTPPQHIMWLQNCTWELGSSTQHTTQHQVDTTVGTWNTWWRGIAALCEDQSQAAALLTAERLHAWARCSCFPQVFLAICRDLERGYIDSHLYLSRDKGLGRHLQQQSRKYVCFPGKRRWSIVQRLTCFSFFQVLTFANFCLHGSFSL